MRSWVAGTALALALVAVLGWPALATAWTAWDESRVNPSEAAFAVHRPLALARTSILLVLLTEAIALPPGILLAFALFRTDVWGRRAMLALIALAVFVPLPLHATAWLGAIGNVGRSQAIGSAPILVRLPGAAFVHAMAAIPWVVLLAGVGLRSVEPELEESALLDLPAWQVVLQVTFRRAAGGLAGSALAVAVLVSGDMTVTDLLQVRTYAEESYTQFQLGAGMGGAAAVALPPMMILGGLIVLFARGLLRADPARLASAATRGRVWRLGRWRLPAGMAIVAVVGNLIALPLYGLIWRAGRVGGNAALGVGPRWSLAGLGGTLRDAAAEAASPLATTATRAALAATLTVALAWALAWASRRPGPWRWVVALSVALALAVPGSVAGAALKIAYLRVPPVYDTSAILVLAAVLRTFPYALLVLWPAIRTIPPEHLESAALDGYGPWGQVRRVALPLTRAAILAAWGIAFSLALGELPASNIAAPAGVTTLPLVIWSLLHYGAESHLAGIALVTLAGIGGAGLFTAWALGRVGRQFREGAA